MQADSESLDFIPEWSQELERRGVTQIKDWLNKTQKLRYAFSYGLVSALERVLGTAGS
jgi:hypothetical protein